MKKDNALIAQILCNIPPNMNAVDYLMDVLSIGRESVYRRLRGKIPFTFDEVVKLSLELDFSVDEIIDKSQNKQNYADLKVRLSHEADEAFMQTLGEFYDHLVRLSKSTEKETIVTLNRLLFPLLIGYDHLFRFTYYKWIHQMRDVSINYSLSEVVMTTEMLSLYDNIKKHLQTVRDNNIYIFDYNLFLSAIKEIQYYYKRKLITDDEIRLLKEDFLLMFSKMERMAKKGQDEIGSITYYYLSTLNIDSNNIYTCSDGKAVSYFWSSPVNPISVTNPAACEVHRKWLNSMKKYSILITQSNEILLAEFLNKQRAYVANIVDGIFV